MAEKTPEEKSLLIDPQSDRRRLPRKRVKSHFVAGSITGRLVDVSEAGLGLEALQPLPVLMRSTFTLEIGKARPRFRGEVRWCRLTGTAESELGDNVPVYRAGIMLAER